MNTFCHGLYGNTHQCLALALTTVPAHCLVSLVGVTILRLTVGLTLKQARLSSVTARQTAQSFRQGSVRSEAQLSSCIETRLGNCKDVRGGDG